MPSKRKSSACVDYVPKSVGTMVKVCPLRTCDIPSLRGVHHERFESCYQVQRLIRGGRETWVSANVIARSVLKQDQYSRPFVHTDKHYGAV